MSNLVGRKEVLSMGYRYDTRHLSKQQQEIIRKQDERERIRKEENEKSKKEELKKQNSEEE